jgi:hypothetical protein
MQKQAIESSSHPRYKVLCWMHRNAAQHIDRCNELNTTGLAESAADEFDLCQDDDGTIPEWVFDAAVLVEIRRQERGIRTVRAA